jgi:hypothetical protein
MEKYTQHALSAAWPAMEQDDFTRLVESVKANGLFDPITLFEGEIIDGWHRYHACEIAGLEPRFVELPDDVDPVAFSQKNADRRHLTKSQIAAGLVAITAWQGRGRPKWAPGAYLTAGEIAKKAGVSERTIKHAKKAHEIGLGEAVRDGKVSAKVRQASPSCPRKSRKRP